MRRRPTATALCILHNENNLIASITSVVLYRPPYQVKLPFIVKCILIAIHIRCSKKCVFVSLSLTVLLTFTVCVCVITKHWGAPLHHTSYMAVLLGLSGSKVMISMWIRPDWIKKERNVVLKICLKRYIIYYIIILY